MTPPGWYPDPYAPASLRWWSGYEWTGYTAPGPGSGSKPTDGFAIASLVTSLVGLLPVGIVLGFVAKRRIRGSEGRLGGDGLATAGIATGFAYLALTGVIVALVLSGAFDGDVNADDYSGEEAEVAKIVDRFEAAREDGDAVEICSELFTGDLKGTYSSRAGGCEGAWNDDETLTSDIDIGTLLVTGDTATAFAQDEYGEQWRFEFRRTSNGWRISEVD